jgi:hypothetical protein
MENISVKIFGIAKWRLVPNEPRHNTWHNALYDSAQQFSINLRYIGRFSPRIQSLRRG